MLKSNYVRVTHIELRSSSRNKAFLQLYINCYIFRPYCSSSGVYGILLMLFVKADKIVSQQDDMVVNGSRVPSKIFDNG